MKHLLAFFLILFITTLSFVSYANLTNGIGNKNSDVSSENENVKSKMCLLFLKTNKFNTVGYSLNSQVLFGARFSSCRDYFLPQDISNVDYFICPIKNGKIEDAFFSSDKFKEYNEISGKFIISAEDKKGIDLYVVEFCNGVFSKPERLAINSSGNEINGSFNNDGTKIFFASDRKGGYGGYDIYESELIGKNKWCEPKNLGPAVNTSADDICPYILKDNLTLYFSSKGHQSSDNFDIYVAIMDDDGNWGEPEKLGEPINSDKDDLYYRMSPDETRAVYYTIGDSGEGIYELVFY